MENALVSAAASYLTAGLAVIALTGKQPNTAFHRRGLLDAIRGLPESPEDVHLIEGVFGDSATTGIGIVIPEHLVVVDIDGEEGAQQWRTLVADDELAPETPVARTGRGLHLWFLTPAVRRTAKLGPKLDLKGVGGYVAAPPSLHPDGHRYEWLVPLVMDGMVTGIEWLPAGIERILAVDDAIERDDHVERPVYTLYNLSLQEGRWRLRREVVPPPIDGLVKAVEAAVEGNRNNMLAWAALQARDEGVKLEDALRDLGGAATRAGLTAQEVRTTIRSAYRRRPQ